MRNKFDLLAEQIKGNVDLLAISQAKLDDSFPVGQFKILGYASPFRLDRNQNDVGILAFVREDIPVKFLSSEERPIEAFFFELNRDKKKRLVCCCYNPNKSNISRHLDTLRKSLDLYSVHYENTILIAGFNVSIDDPHMEFCIDLILTNNLYSFQNSWVIETGPSDFHKMIVSVMKTPFQKLKPRIVQYRDYTQFSNDNFRKKLLEKLCLENINTNSNGLAKFLQICVNTLDQMAPRKKIHMWQ